MSEETRYCSACGINHPASEMRQVKTFNGFAGTQRWQCIRTINAMKKKNQASRDEFGKQHSKANRAWSPDKPRLKV